MDPAPIRFIRPPHTAICIRAIPRSSPCPRRRCGISRYGTRPAYLRRPRGQGLLIHLSTEATDFFKPYRRVPSFVRAESTSSTGGEVNAGMERTRKKEEKEVSRITFLGDGELSVRRLGSNDDWRQEEDDPGSGSHLSVKARELVFFYGWQVIIKEEQRL